MTGPSADDTVSVLDRMTQILQAFDHDDRGIALSDLARRSGLPKSTVSRLVATLVQQRYLERDGRRIHLGLRVFELGQLAREPRELRMVALPILVQLRDKTRENVHLAIPDGRELVCVAAVRGRTDALSRVGMGVRLPLHATALGKAVLAYAPPQVVEDAFAAGLASLTPYTITDDARLRRQLTDIRTGALAIEQREFASDAAGIAVPVFTAPGRLAAALSVSGLADEFDIEGIAPVLRGAAAALCRRLSAPPR